MPRFILLGGPNGVGKSTKALDYLREEPNFVSIDGDRILREFKLIGRGRIEAEDYIISTFKNAVRNSNNIILESNLTTPKGY